MIPTSLLPNMIRDACLSASQEFRRTPKRHGDGDTRTFSYASPQLTRSLLLSRYCSILKYASDGTFPSKMIDPTRVCCTRQIELKSGRKIYPGEKGAITKVASEGTNGLTEIRFDCGIVYNGKLGAGIIEIPPEAPSWGAWASGRHVISGHVGTMLCSDP